MAQSQTRDRGSDTGHIDTTVNGKDLTLKWSMQGSTEETLARQLLARDDVVKARIDYDGKVMFRVHSNERYPCARDYVPEDYEILDVGIHRERRDGTKSFYVTVKKHD